MPSLLVLRPDQHSLSSFDKGSTSSKKEHCPFSRGFHVFIACGKSVEDILGEYPYLEREDVMEALSYAAWRSEEQELPMVTR